MNDAAMMILFHRKYDVKHFVIDDGLDDLAWHAGTVERTTQGDGFMRRIVMAQNRLRSFAAPSDLADFKLALEETLVERAKNCIEIVAASLRRAKTLVPARPPGLVDAPADSRSHRVREITSPSFARRLLAVASHNQHFGQGFDHNGRRVAQYVKHLNLISAVFSANRAARVRPFTENDLELGSLCPRPQPPVDSGKEVFGAQHRLKGQCKL